MTLTNKEAIERILKECAHPVDGRTEAAIWQECRSYWISQGEDRILAGERAWLHINPYGGDCDYLKLPLDPMAVPPSKPDAPSGAPTALTPAIRAEVRAEHRASYEMYCEIHESEACKPSECEYVSVYHVTPRVEHELTCQGPFCGRAFTANRADARFHSDACRKAAKRASAPVR